MRVRSEKRKGGWEWNSREHQNLRREEERHKVEEIKR